MVSCLKDKLESFRSKTSLAVKLSLVTFAFVYQSSVDNTLWTARSVPMGLYVSHIADSSKNDQAGELINNELVWESIQPNPGDYSTLEMVKRTNILVLNSVQKDKPGSSEDIEDFLNGHSSTCRGYTFLTGAGLADLTEDHPELSHHLKNIRIVGGNASDGRIETGHAWIEVKVGDEWVPYETTYDIISEPLEDIDLEHLSELHPDFINGVEYKPWISFWFNEDGYLEGEMNHYNIYVHGYDATKYVFKELEALLGRRLLDRPYTNLLTDFITVPASTLAGYGIFDLTIKLTRKLKTKFRGKD